MSAPTPLLTPVPDTRAGKRNIFRAATSSPLAVASAAVLTAILIAVIVAPLLAPYGPNEGSLDATFAPISASHWLGGDSAGRDVLSRLLYGGRITLGSAGLAVLVAMVIGVPTGLWAGFYGRGVDAVTTWVSNLVIALPGIVVLLALRPVMGSSPWTSMLVFGVLLAPAFFVLVRTLVANVRNELYVDAARVSGLSDARIIGRHILGVVRAPIIIQAAMVLAIALFVQSGLEFLGFGNVAEPTWGGMLNEAFSNLFRGPQLLLWPGLAIGITCAALALLANGLRDALEGSTSTRKSTRRRPARAAGEVDSSLASGETEPTDAEAVIRIDDLRIEYVTDGNAVEVLHGVDLTINPGEVVGVVGESGSGKTQVALGIMGLLPDNGRVAGGTIRFRGEPVGGRRSRQHLGRSIAYIPQEPMTNLDPAFTIGSQLSEPLRHVAGLSGRRARARVMELLDSVGIAEPERVFRAYPHEISGGMAQRVLIAGAISNDPLLVIADEPTTALDVTVQADILALLRRLQRERGMAMLLVTHNFGVVSDICERVYVMKRGRIVESAATIDLYRSPQEEYTKTLLSHILDGGPARDELDRQAAEREIA